MFIGHLFLYAYIAEQIEQDTERGVHAMPLEKIVLSETDALCIRQHAEDGRGCGHVNNDGHLYFIDQPDRVAYRLPDAYKDTPIVLYHPCGGYQDGLIMVSLMGEVRLQYFHTFSDTAGVWGWIDMDGNAVIEPQFVFAMSFFNGRAIVCKGEWCMNENEEYWCDEERWGIIDRRGKEIVPCRYDEVYAIDDTDRFILCHKNGWEKGCSCIFDIDTGKELPELDLSFDNGYMLNSCFYHDGCICFTEHEPGGEVDYIYAYHVGDKKWLCYHEACRGRTLDGKMRITVHKDGNEIMVF